MKIFLRIPPGADCGVGYYRQWLPLNTAKKKGELDFRCNKFTWGERSDESDNPMPEPSVEELSKDAKWADLLYFSRNDVPQYIAQAGGLGDFHTKPIVLDIDDNVQATRPYNPGYRSFHPNSPNMAWNIKSLGVFDAITVSTENLKEYYSQYTDADKIYVCPNSLDWERRDKSLAKKYTSELYKKDKDEIRIGWSGSAAHWENLKHIEKPIADILKKYPKATFYYTGLFGDLFQDPEIKDRVKTVSWAGLKDWSDRNVEMNLDIAVAPLADNMFNRAKSNLRILEFGSAGYPVIATPVEPYRTFEDGVEIMHATEKDEWFEALDELVGSKERREYFGNNLSKKVRKDYDIDKNYKIWTDAMKDIQKKYAKKLKKFVKEQKKATK